MAAVPKVDVKRPMFQSGEAGTLRADIPGRGRAGGCGMRACRPRINSDDTPRATAATRNFSQITKLDRCFVERGEVADVTPQRLRFLGVLGAAGVRRCNERVSATRPNVTRRARPPTTNGLRSG